MCRFLSKPFVYVRNWFATPRGRVVRYKARQALRLVIGMVGLSIALTTGTTFNLHPLQLVAGTIGLYMLASGIKGCWKSSDFEADQYLIKRPVVTITKVMDADPVSAAHLKRIGVVDTPLGLSLHGKALYETSIRFKDAEGVDRSWVFRDKPDKPEFSGYETQNLAKVTVAESPPVPTNLRTKRTNDEQQKSQYARRNDGAGLEAFSGNGYLVDESDQLPGCTFCIWLPRPEDPGCGFKYECPGKPQFPAEYFIFTTGDYITCPKRDTCDFGCVHTYARLALHDPKLAIITVGKDTNEARWYTDVSVSGKFPGQADNFANFICLAKDGEIPQWFLQAVVPENSLMHELFHPYDACVFQWDLKWPMLKGIKKFKGKFETNMDSTGVSYSIDARKGVYRIDPHVRVHCDNQEVVTYGCAKTTCEGSQGTSSCKSWTNSGVLASMHHGGIPGVKGLRNRATPAKCLEQLRIRFANYGKGHDHLPDYTAFAMKDSVWNDLVTHVKGVIADEAKYGTDLNSLPEGYTDDMWFSPEEFTKPLTKCTAVTESPSSAITKVHISRAMRVIKRQIKTSGKAMVSKSLLYATAKDQVAYFDELAHAQLEQEAEDQNEILVHCDERYGDGFEIETDRNFQDFGCATQNYRSVADGPVFGTRVKIDSKSTKYSDERYSWAVWQALKKRTAKPLRSDFPRAPDPLAAGRCQQELAKRRAMESPTPAFVSSTENVPPESTENVPPESMRISDRLAAWEQVIPKKKLETIDELRVRRPELFTYGPEQWWADYSKMNGDYADNPFAYKQCQLAQAIGRAYDVEMPMLVSDDDPENPDLRDPLYDKFSVRGALSKTGLDNESPPPEQVVRPPVEPAPGLDKMSPSSEEDLPRTESIGLQTPGTASTRSKRKRPPRRKNTPEGQLHSLESVDGFVAPARKFPIYLGDYEERADEDEFDRDLPIKEIDHSRMVDAEGKLRFSEATVQALKKLQETSSPEPVPGLRKSLLRANLLSHHEEIEEWCSTAGLKHRAEVFDFLQELIAGVGLSLSEQQEEVLIRSLEYGAMRDDHGRSIPKASTNAAATFWNAFDKFLGDHETPHDCLKTPMKTFMEHLNSVAGVLDGHVSDHEVFTRLLGKEISLAKGKEHRGNTPVDPKIARHIGKTTYKSGDFKSTPWCYHKECDGWFAEPGWKEHVWDSKRNQPAGAMAARGPEYIIRSLNAQLGRKNRRKEALCPRHLKLFSHGLPCPKAGDEPGELLNMTVGDYLKYLFHDINSAKGTAYSRLSGHMTKGEYLRDPHQVLGCLLTVFLTVALDHDIALGASPTALFRFGILCPEEVFGKDEVHLNKKVDGDRLRVIWNAATRFEVVMRFFHHIQNKMEIGLYQEDFTHSPEYPTFGQCVGMGHDDESITRQCDATKRLMSFQAENAHGYNIMRHDFDNDGDFSDIRSQLRPGREARAGKLCDGIASDYMSACLSNSLGGKDSPHAHWDGLDLSGPHNGVSSDPQGWDISVTRALGMSDAWRRADAASEGGFGIGWCYGLMNVGVVATAHIIIVADDVFELLWFGILSSGIPSTSATNSFERIFLHSSAYWLTVGLISLSLGMGDDGIGRNRIRQAQLDAWHRFGCVMKPPEFSDLGTPVAFTSHDYDLDAQTATYENAPKMLLRLAYAGVGTSPITMEQATGIRFAVRNTPELLQLVEDFVRFYDETGTWLEVDVGDIPPNMDLTSVF